MPLHIHISRCLKVPDSLWRVTVRKRKRTDSHPGVTAKIMWEICNLPPQHCFRLAIDFGGDGFKPQSKRTGMLFSSCSSRNILLYKVAGSNIQNTKCFSLSLLKQLNWKHHFWKFLGIGIIFHTLNTALQYLKYLIYSAISFDLTLYIYIYIYIYIYEILTAKATNTSNATLSDVSVYIGFN
jgi:hypothetical protein